MRRGLQILLPGVLAMLVMSVAPALVWAAAAQNPLDFKTDLGIWTVVIFVLLMTVLGKYAWGPMMEGLHKREESIRSALEEAKQAREETARVRAEFLAEKAKAQEQIAHMLDQARRDAQQLIDDMRTKATADIQTDRQRLRREIELARDQALQDIWAQAAQLATLISTKALKRAINVDDHRRLVDEALAELRQKAGNA